MPMPKRSPQRVEHLEAPSLAELGEAIRKARENRSLSGDALAKRVGVKPPTLSAWEHGRHGPTLEHLICLAAVLDEPLDWFAGPRADVEGSLEGLSRRLGLAIGRGRLRSLLSLPEARLRRDLDALVGAWIAEQHDRRS